MSNQSPESSLNLSHTYIIDGRPPCVAGTRWLTRFDKEVELSVRLVYHALTTGRGQSPPSQSIPQTARSLIPNILFFLAIQTLGEEYTNVWAHPKWARSPRIRAALVLLPTIPSYILARLGPPLFSCYPRSKGVVTAVMGALDVAGEVNLAMFYISGVYYRLVRRLLGVPHVRAQLSLTTCLG